MNFRRGWDRLCKVALIGGMIVCAGTLIIGALKFHYSDQFDWGENLFWGILIAIASMIPYGALRVIGWIVAGFMEEGDIGE